MKRTSRILISVAAFFVACSNAFAAIEIDENIYNSADNAIVVSGKVTDSKANLPMGVIISKGGNVVFADYILAKEKEDGTIKFSFSPYVLPVTTSSADFEIKVFSDIEMEQQSRMYSYTGNDEKFLILKSLGTANNVDSTILNEGAKINLRASLYSCISDRSDLINKIAAIDLNLPEQCVTEDECKRVQSALAALETRYNELCCNYQLAEVSDGTTYRQWENSWLAFLGMGDAFTNYYNAAKANAGFVTRVSGLAAGDTLADAKQNIFNCVFLETVNNSGYQTVMQMWSDFPQYLDLSSEFSGLTDVQISKKLEAVAGKNYQSIEDFKTAIKTANINSGTNSRPTGSPGGGNTTTNVSIGTNPVTSAVVAQQNSEMIFADIESVSWAKDAIEMCYKRGIISGRTAEIFAPNDNVSRAEFVKMLVSAVNKNVNAEIEFADVSINDWYYQYIKNAYALGLIYGDEHNYFYPNAEITRQDMAVMIYRALDNVTKGENVDFKDSNEISDYAKHAVGYLYQSNLISGIGDNIFAPLKSTTRAEAASIIYRVFLK